MKRTEQTVLAILTIVVVLTTGIQLGLISQQYGYAETGTSGDDTITTGTSDDNNVGLGGDDTIDSDGGDDTNDGGTGDDTIRQWSGDDTNDGGTGKDDTIRQWRWK